MLVCTVSSLITHVATKSVIMPAGVRVFTIIINVARKATYASVDTFLSERKATVKDLVDDRVPNLFTISGRWSVMTVCRAVMVTVITLVGCRMVRAVACNGGAAAIIVALMLAGTFVYVALREGSTTLFELVKNGL